MYDILTDQVDLSVFLVLLIAPNVVLSPPYICLLCLQPMNELKYQEIAVLSVGIFGVGWLPKPQALDIWSTNGTWSRHCPAWATKQCLAHVSNSVPRSQHSPIHLPTTYESAIQEGGSLGIQNGG